MEKKYYTTIGLEIHAELKTKSKMFCACKNDPDETNPNINICPVCMAHPGTLPVPNKTAIENVIKIGLAIDGNIADFSEFDRKNYFYPDIPKGYQISQFKYPIVSGGKLAGFDITRIHLEEDTANSKHISVQGLPGQSRQPLDIEGHSLIDFNRAGVPLSELVTEAMTFEDVNEASKTASNFAKEYQLLLWYLGVSEANMEKGEMRVEANVSVSPDKDKKWSAYVEVKNLNSFKTVEKAIKYEVNRKIELFEAGRENEIVKETRGWDENKQASFSQRKKESSQDYRYFPDPDLPKMKLHEAFDIENLKKDIKGKLPEDIRNEYRKLEAKEEDIEVFINHPEWKEWLEQVSKNLKTKEAFLIALNFIKSDFVGMLKTTPTIKLLSPENFSELTNLFADNKISSRGAKDILAMIVVKDESPQKIAEEKGLLQQNDEGALKVIAKKILDENSEAVASYKAGKENAIMALVGKIMKESNGSANPQVAKNILLELLK